MFAYLNEIFNNTTNLIAEVLITNSIETNYNNGNFQKIHYTYLYTCLLINKIEISIFMESSKSDLIDVSIE